MSTALRIDDYEDLPCLDWGIAYDIDHFLECPMKDKWEGGQEVICSKCGIKIYYNVG